MTAQKMQIRHNIFHLKLLLSWNSTYVTKKRVWQVTTIIQLALCHLVTSHFQEIACNYTPKGQIRWPIFLLLLCMIVLTEITSKFPKPIIFRILVFSCHKMTLITIITRMPQPELELTKHCVVKYPSCYNFSFVFYETIWGFAVGNFISHKGSLPNIKESSKAVVTAFIQGHVNDGGGYFLTYFISHRIG